MSSHKPTNDQRLALRALVNGKAPPTMHGQLFVGRRLEIESLEHDLDLVEAGGASLRILIGEPGSGKTMLQQVMADRARQRGFVTSRADLTPDRLFHGRRGEGRALLSDLTHAMRAPAASDGPAIDAIVSRFANDCQAAAAEATQANRAYIRTMLGELHAQPKGAEFARVIETFALAPEASSLAMSCRRWLCGEYPSLGEAREELGVGSIVEDQDLWLMARHWASFLRLAGRPGLVLFIDEAQVLCGLHNPHARMLNFEHLLSIFNDVLQGRVQGLAVVIAATPAFATQWNGLAKHEGLSSCLLQGGHAVPHLHPDSTFLHLQDFTEPELHDLVRRCRDLYASCRPGAPVLPDDGVDEFLQGCRNQIGEYQWKTPRRIMQAFLSLHDRWLANPTLGWVELLYPQEGGCTAPEMALDGYAHRQM